MNVRKFLESAKVVGVACPYIEFWVRSCGDLFLIDEETEAEIANSTSVAQAELERLASLMIMIKKTNEGEPTGMATGVMLCVVSECCLINAKMHEFHKCKGMESPDFMMYMN